MTLESALINVAAELERQVKHILTTKRNETHWKQISHRSESIRQTVPVEEEEVLDIQEEIRQRTESSRGRPKRLLNCRAHYPKRTYVCPPIFLFFY